LPKSDGFSFILWANGLFLLRTAWPGHFGDAPIKPLQDSAITDTEALSQAIYNCRISLIKLIPLKRNEPLTNPGRVSILADTGGEIKERKLNNRRERQKGRWFDKIEAKEHRKPIDCRREEKEDVFKARIH
jgi:hypothetical protein